MVSEIRSRSITVAQQRANGSQHTTGKCDIVLRKKVILLLLIISLQISLYLIICNLEQSLEFMKYQIYDFVVIIPFIGHHKHYKHCLKACLNAGSFITLKKKSL